MKTKLLPTIAIACILSLFCQQASAKIWRVNNRSNYNGASLYGDNFGGTAAYPVFAQINQAVTFGIVNNGDTLHIEGSTTNYAFATITKKLVIIGTGYFLTQNPNVSNSVLESNIARISFNDGSEGSQLMGVNMVSSGNTADRDIYINVNNILVKRCRIEGNIVFGFPLTDAYIIENFFPAVSAVNVLSTNGNTAFVPPTDIVFNNNICQRTLTWGSPIANPTTFWPILQCNNNVFDGPDNLATPNLAFTTSEFRGNILMPTNAITAIQASAGVVNYNIGTLSTQFGTTDNNLVIANIASLFIMNNSTDGAYQITPASQANNTSYDGTDRGAFGGAITNRYTLSGLANIPDVYKVTTSGVGNGSINVVIQARTIK